MSESMPVGSRIGAIHPARDADRGLYGQVTYQLIGGHNRDQFRMDTRTGKRVNPSSRFFYFDIKKVSRIILPNITLNSKIQV